MIKQSTDLKEFFQRLLKRSISRYAVPFCLLGVFLAIVVYAVASRDTEQVPAGIFPKTDIEFVKDSRLDARLSKLHDRIAANPNDIQALFESGLLKFQKGRDHYVEAIADLEASRAKGLVDVRVFYYLGQMYQAVGLYDFALQEYQRFLNNRPEDFEVRMLAAKLMFLAGKYPQAVAEYESINSRYPRNMLVLENMALARWKNAQDWKPVTGELASLGEEASFRSDYVSGRIHYENKEYAQAAPLLERSAAVSVKYPGFTDRRALYAMRSDAYMKLKSETQAMKALNELLNIDPSNDEARSLLARLVKARKRTASAKKK